MVKIKSQIIFNPFYFCFPLLYRHASSYCPFLGVVANAALTLVCYWTSENIFTGPPLSFSLSFPWNSQPSEHVECKSKPLSTKFHCPELLVQGAECWGENRTTRMKCQEHCVTRPAGWMLGAQGALPCGMIRMIIWTENRAWNGSK